MASHSPDGSPGHSRASSQGNVHRPAQPSGLRQSHRPPPSPDSRMLEYFEDDGIHPTSEPVADVDRETIAEQAMLGPPAPDARTRLLEESHKYTLPRAHTCEDENCQHGTWSPKSRYGRGYGSFAGSIAPSEASQDGITSRIRRRLARTVTDNLFGEQNGHGARRKPNGDNVKHSRTKYAPAFPAHRNTCSSQ
jgi:hypothetical protein